MKQNKIILSFLVGIIALSTATLGMSIAWYATSQILYVNAIEITIDSERALDICTTIDGEYREEYSYSELTPTSVFRPVTTAHSSTWISQRSDNPIFYDESKFINTNEEVLPLRPVTEDFYSQEFYLKADHDIYVTINPEQTYFKPNALYNRQYAQILYNEFQAGTDPTYKGLTVEQIEERLNQLVKAMRFSILITDDNDYRYEIIDPNKNGETLLGGVLDNDTNRYFDNFERDDVPYERVYGEVIGDRNLLVYDDPLDTDSDYVMPTEEPSAFNAKHKKGVKRFNLEKTLQKEGVSIQTEQSYSVEDFKQKEKPFLIPLYKEQPKRVVISIYIEGWDLDSVNYTMGATFDASLGFKIERDIL